MIEPVYLSLYGVGIDPARLLRPFGAPGIETPKPGSIVADTMDTSIQPKKTGELPGDGLESERNNLKKIIQHLRHRRSITLESHLAKALSYACEQWSHFVSCFADWQIGCLPGARPGELEEMLPANWTAANRTTHPAIKSERPQAA